MKSTVPQLSQLSQFKTRPPEAQAQPMHSQGARKLAAGTGAAGLARLHFGMGYPPVMGPSQPFEGTGRNERETALVNVFFY